MISNTELEKEIIKLMIDNQDSISEVCTLINPADFVNEINRKNFEEIKRSFFKDGVIDLGLIKNISEYLDSAWYESALLAGKKCGQLRDLSKKRSLSRLSDEINRHLDKDSDWIISSVGKSLSKIKSSSEPYSSDVRDVGKAVMKRWEETKGKSIIGLDIGIKQLNKVIYGYQPGHYWVIGAYTNYGKTAFASYLASMFMKEYPLKNIAFFSVEMGNNQIYERVLSQYLSKGIYYVRNNAEKFKDELENFNSCGLVVYDNKRNVQDIKFELTALSLQGKKPAIVFVDFLQNLQEDGNEYERMSYATLQLQTMAIEMGICVIALSQISNDGVKNKSEIIPFKGSGTIAASADLAIQLMRNKEQELEQNLELTELEVRIVKNRHGRGIKFNLDLDLTNGVLSTSIISNKTYDTKPERTNSPPPRLID